jgi:SAM-dependent methyltransferase
MTFSGPEIAGRRRPCGRHRTRPSALRYPVVPLDARSILTDKSYLTAVQYQTGANLAARQSIYAFAQPKIDLVATVLGLAGLAGTETVADIGCGNGIYLAGLARRGHTGRVLGIDLSPGMLATAKAAAAGASLAVGDAAALPLADAVADATLAPHMLYHVPDPRAAVAELRRVTRPDGQLLVVLNCPDHLAELRELMLVTAAAAGQPTAEIARSRSPATPRACRPRACLTRTASPGPCARAFRSARTGCSGSGPTAACSSAADLPGAQPCLDVVERYGWSIRAARRSDSGSRWSAGAPGCRSPGPRAAP